MDNANNWRLHPQFQGEALDGVLEEVGIVAPLLAYHSEKYGGLTLLDGHLRKSRRPDQEWPVIILDINDEEADIVLAHFDSISSWAGTDARKLGDLLEKMRGGNDRFEAAKARLKEGIAAQLRVQERMEARERGEEVEEDTIHRNLNRDRSRSVTVVLPIEEGLEVFEQAMKHTGLKNRAEALVAISRYFLDTVKA